MVTSIINCFTSFFSGFVIFSTLGYMSELTNSLIFNFNYSRCKICNVGPVSDVVGEGESSLIFIVYPQALATMVFFMVLINYLYLADFHWAVSFTQFMVEDHPS